MKPTTLKAAVLLSILSVTVAISACKRTEPEKGAAPAVPMAQAPAAPAAPPPEPVATPEQAPPATDTPAPATAATGAASSTVGASKGAATSRSKKAPVLRAVRSANQQGFDRVAFEFDSAGLPAWRAEYVERPINCGSGEPVRVAGNAWLQISFTGAHAHTERGESTGGPRRKKLSQPIARELVRTCAFEGEITYVIGVAKPNAYTPRTMSAPSRLVIDLTH